jgi:S-adenosylmethionine hydrolase
MAKARPCVITLTTDFGTQDGNVGVMKGVILGLNPKASIVDLSHDVPPQDIADAAYVLRRAYRYFPHGTIHVVVVDPGVGSERRAIAVEAPHSFLVAPDNGVLTYVLQELQDDGHEIRVVSLTNTAYWLPQVSNVFHGRDIFAPVAAHLSLGADIGALGQEIHDPITLPPAPLELLPGHIIGQVAHIDHFGNLLTNIPASQVLSLGDSMTTRVAEREISGLSKTFSQGKPGEPIAYIDSSGHLAIASVNASAQELLNSHVGQMVEVTADQAMSIHREAS